MRRLEGQSQKRLVAGVVVVVAVVGAFLIAYGGRLLSPQHSGDPTYHHTLTISPGTASSVVWELEQGLGVYGVFNVTSPTSPPDNVVNFFICDKESYNAWVNGSSVTRYLFRTASDSSFKFRIPHHSTWYFVFDNNATDVTKVVQVTVSQDATPPDIETNIVGGATYSGVVSVHATITDRFEISIVEFLVDGAVVTTTMGDEFAYDWDTSLWANGEHTVTLRAADSVGNSRSIEYKVTIAN